MLSSFTVVLPIFMLMSSGWVVRRRGIVSERACGELNKLVVHLALPALLFSVVAHASLGELWMPDFLLGFGLSAAAIFAVTFALRLTIIGSVPIATIDALTAGYSNTGFIGFPLALAVFGQQAMVPTLIATLVTVCVMFAVAIFMVELASQSSAGTPIRVILRVLGSLARNPLLLGPALGLAFPLSGLAVPQVIDTYTKLLGSAAPPCALVCLGYFLAEKRPAEVTEWGLVAALTGLKLVLQPAIALATCALLGLPPFLTQVAVLMAALPTGTGPFMLSELYGTQAETTAKAILLSTTISIVTLSFCLLLVAN
ncbi:MAG: AEC family transporter [Rhodobacteraceae bacterium]|nr:AEC family transporter [Paracoccaceae bacterium]